MKNQQYEIVAPKPLADDLVEALEADPGSTLQVVETRKNFSGADAVALVANLTTIGLGILQVWQARNASVASSIEVRKTPTDEAVEQSGHHAGPSTAEKRS